MKSRFEAACSSLVFLHQCAIASPTRLSTKTTAPSKKHSDPDGWARVLAKEHDHLLLYAQANDSSACMLLCERIRCTLFVSHVVRQHIRREVLAARLND